MTPVRDATTAPLPAAVRRFLERSALGGPPSRQVRITQSGHMWRTPGGRRLAFTATQGIAVDRVAFRWSARFPLFGPLAMTVVDECGAGAGALTVRLLGVPVARQSGPEMAVGEAIRYLAELPLVPEAMRRNPDLEWREVADDDVEVATVVAGERAAVTFHFDAAGDIVTATSTGRPRSEGRGWVSNAWGGEFADYALLGGVRLPTRASAWWDLPGGRFTYWRGGIAWAIALGEPLARA